MKYPDRIKKSIWAFGHEQTSQALMVHMLNEVYWTIEAMIDKPQKGTQEDQMTDFIGYLRQVSKERKAELDAYRQEREQAERIRLDSAAQVFAEEYYKHFKKIAKAAAMNGRYSTYMELAYENTEEWPLRQRGLDMAADILTSEGFKVEVSRSRILLDPLPFPYGSPLNPPATTYHISWEDHD